MTDIGSMTQKRNLVLPTFLNMPLNVANLVLEKMGPHNLLRVRRVCRSLRSAVDEFGIHFGCIGLLLGKDVVEMRFGGTETIYTTAANDSSNVIQNGQKKLIDGENIVERATKDFKILSKHARKIAIRNYSEDRREIVTTFNELLKSEKSIHVNEIAFWSFTFDDVLTILPCFGSNVLNKIELIWITSIDQFKRITHLEQWANAKVCIVSSLNSKIASTVIVHFFHFKCFNIYELDEFPAQAAIQIRDDLFKRSTFQSCVIYFDRSKSNPIEIAKVFKPDYAGGNEFNIEYSNSNNKFVVSIAEIKLPPHKFQLNVKRLSK